MKTPLLLLLTCLSSVSAWAADPFWKQGLSDETHEITVYRSETCGCCKGWIAHLREHNFTVKDITVESVSPYKEKLGVPRQAASCHTAVVDGVVIEGHVPAQDIKAVLAKEEHDIRLLTVPAMPSGTPGMDTPGAPKDPFNVFAVHQDERASVYKSYANY